MGLPPTLTTAGVFTAQDRDAVNALLSRQASTPGNVFWVKPATGSDANDGKTAGSAFKTLSHALATAEGGQNDEIRLCAESNTASSTTDYQSTKLDWNKDLVHLIGVNSGGFLGQRSRISNKSTAVSLPILVELSGNGCRWENLEIYHGAGSNDPSAASTCLKVSGAHNTLVNCQISGIGDTKLDDANSNSLTVTGAENTFVHCYIGLDTVIRANLVAEVVISGTAARNTFEDCEFATYTSAATAKLVSIATSVDRWIKFKNCEFYAAQNITGAVKPTGALGVTTLNGLVKVLNPGLFGVVQITTADNAYVLVLGHDGTATGNLIGIAQGVNAA